MKLLEIGEIIKERRTHLRLTQEDLSEMSGTGIRTIHQIETGVGNPSYQTLNKIFDILGLNFFLHIKGTK